MKQATRAAGRPSAARSNPQTGLNAWISTRFDVYGRACLAVCLVVAPIAFYHIGSGVFWITPKVAVIWLGGLGALGFWAFWCAERRSWPPRYRLLWATAGYVAAASVATALSLSPRLSLVGLYQRYGGLLPLLVYVGVMVAVVGLHWEKPERLRVLQTAIAGSAMVQACSVLLQQAGIDRTLWDGPVPGTVFDYPPGLQGHSNFAGAHLGVAAPCLWYLARTTRSVRARRVVGAALGVDLLALWYTRCRGGMLAAVIGLGAFALANRARPLRAPAKAALAAAASAAVVAGIVLGVRAGGDTPPQPTADADVLRAKTVGLRLAYWAAAVRIIGDHPIVGTGLDTFYAYYPAYRAPAEGVVERARIAVDKPHNVFLEHAADSGLVGLATYLSVVVLALLYGFRRCRRSDGHERALLAAFLGLLCAYLAQAAVSIDQPSLAMTGWVAVAGCAALADPALVRAREAKSAGSGGRRTPGEPVPGRRRLRRAVLFLAVPAAVGATAIGLAPLRANLAAHDGRFADAVGLDPTNSDDRVLAGRRAQLAGDASPDAVQKSQLLSAARKDYLDALALKPRDTTALTGLAAVETSWASGLDPAHFADAERWWRKAFALDPHNQLLRQAYLAALPPAVSRTVTRLEAQAQVRLNDAGARADLAYAYLAQGETAKAQAAAQSAIAIDPGNGRARAFLAVHPAP